NTYSSIAMAAAKAFERYFYDFSLHELWAKQYVKSKGQYIALRHVAFCTVGLVGWLRPVYSEAKRSQVRGLMSSTSSNIRFYDRDVSAALNIRRCAVGPGPRPTELCYWDGRPAMPKPGRPGQEWVYLRDKALLRSHLSSYEKALGWPAQQAGPTDPGILDHIEGVQATLAADKEAAALLPRWERASSLEQVKAALRGIRAAWQLLADVEPQAGSCAGGQGPAGDGVTPSPTGSHQAGSEAELHQWLPGFYDMHPTDSHWCSEQLQQGRLWLLPADTDQVSGGAGYLAVMCLAVSVESRRWCAGIVSSCNAATHAALMHAASQQRHFVAFLDRGLWYASSTEAAADPSSAAYATGCANEAPAVYALAAPGDSLVYAGDAPCQLSLQHLPHQPNVQQVPHKDNVSSSWQQPTAA
ncbi:hypothetical protein QJQ45_025274, partial [Haematococcus lacustris]